MVRSENDPSLSCSTLHIIGGHDAFYLTELLAKTPTGSAAAQCAARGWWEVGVKASSGSGAAAATVTGAVCVDPATGLMTRQLVPYRVLERQRLRRDDRLLRLRRTERHQGTDLGCTAHESTRRSWAERDERKRRIVVPVDVPAGHRHVVGDVRQHLIDAVSAQNDPARH